MAASWTAKSRRCTCTVGPSPPRGMLRSAASRRQLHAPQPAPCNRAARRLRTAAPQARRRSRRSAPEDPGRRQHVWAGRRLRRDRRAVCSAAQPRRGLSSALALRSRGGRPRGSLPAAALAAGRASARDHRRAVQALLAPLEPPRLCFRGDRAWPRLSRGDRRLFQGAVPAAPLVPQAGPAASAARQAEARSPAAATLSG
mmetsp:Transcript_828/g.2612  ORF Transcript_828/g.2612 Transcript_828/m.2612 type:complete len:200 (-) Transcript_828:731-1330(-)